MADAVEAIGPVKSIVSPNKLHHLSLEQWASRWPEARLYASPGLVKKKPGLSFFAELGNAPETIWAKDIDQAIFRGSFMMEEVFFFHRKSGTAIICDLVQRFSEFDLSGWKGVLMKLDGLVGEHGSTPREWRATFLRRNSARATRSKVLNWKPERLLIAHGQCAQNNATAILSNALAWI
ncbi:MAG: DUF4336 domain-containing protein [Gammaproteobacteria bacterium]